MRNLKIVSFERTLIEGDLPLTATAWDASNDSTICAFGPTSTRPIIELKRKVKSEISEVQNGSFEATRMAQITSWDAPCPLPELVCDEILLMQYFPDTATICLVLAGGDLVLVREEPEEGQEKIEIVGSVDVGIAAAAWAPDQELMAIVTKSDSLVLMSRDLEPVTETAMTAEDLKISKHVSVGWGKKETQFQGKRAKAVRDPTMPEYVDEGLLSPFEDGKTTISWRGDGVYLAINAVVQHHRRAIRVFSRDGVLDSVSEPVDGLESALSWKPTGSLITAIKRSTQDNVPKLEVIFFERNGLRHGEFALRLKEAEHDTKAKEISLSWNTDSTILAVSLLDRVQYWTMGNYHYYLKQEITTGHGEACTGAVIWHPEKQLRCSVKNAQSLINLEFISQITRGSTVNPFDYGIVAVIDGSKLKLTPLKHAGVPPPMSFCEIEAGANIVDVAVSQSGQRLAILTPVGIVLGSWRMQSPDGISEPAKLRHRTTVLTGSTTWADLSISVPSATQFTQLAFQGNESVFVLAPTQEQSRAICLHLRVQQPVDHQQEAVCSVSAADRISVAVTTQNLFTDVYQDSVWLQDGQSTKIISNKENMQGFVDIKLPGNQPNSMIYQLTSNTDDDLENGHHVIYHKVSLTSKGLLSAGQRILAKDCTSFVLTDLYLIYTTAQHLLKFIHLTNPEIMEVPNDTPEIDERCRSIERGARIVTVMPSAYAVVLQMPRGNLETIYPRVLVLSGIRESLRKLQYRAAFVACQTHQVDMNIICDYLPEFFMANVHKFVDDLKKPGRIDEFLSKLKEEDVTKTLYADTLQTGNDKSSPPVNGSVAPHNKTTMTGSEKVNAICEAVIPTLQNKSGRFLQCIITAHVCKRPPDLTAALTLSSSLRQSSMEEADMAVSHLCFLTDTNRLFDAALALYDLELTLLVAQNAQRDPREYMPFLQNLQSLSPRRRQYEIDNHLRNHAKALTSLHALEAHDEVRSYTIKHNLYVHAMDLYKYAPTQLSQITVLYAEHLTAQSEHYPAAVLYESLGHYADAYPLYALSHQWRESLTCAVLAHLPSDRLRELASSLATTCADESRDFRSAAVIHTEYLSDPSTAAKLLCKGSYFADATRVLSLHNLVAEIPTTIDTGLTEKFGEIIELVADCKGQLSAQVPRIHELRQKKAEDPLAFYGGDAAAAAADGLDVPDNISLAATDATTAGGQSLFTRYGNGSQGTRFGGTVASSTVSRKTSKTKRREERKRARGKKGSVYEEEYLVASVGRLIDRVNGVHPEVQRLVSGLLRRGMRERASRVGEVMLEVCDACRKARREIWSVDDDVEGAVESSGSGDAADGTTVAVGVDGQTEYRPSGADGVFWDSQMGTKAKKEAPVVKAWKNDVLL